MKLIPFSECDQDNKVDCMILGAIAIDPVTKIHLCPGSGRHKPGRKNRYFICGEWQIERGYVMAYSSNEAIELANKLLEGK